ncbi:protein Mis18-beta isoform X2 [Lissotriton helveticus]
MSRVTRRALGIERSKKEQLAAQQKLQQPKEECESALSQSTTCGRYRLSDLIVFQCKQCYTVLGDSLQMCGQDEKLDCVICLRVTNDVIIEEYLMFDVEGFLAGSSYNPLYCRSCRILLGFCLYSTFRSLAHLRRLFCLSKEKVCCYLLESKKILPASDLNFSLSSLKGKFAELKGSLVEAYSRAQFLEGRMEELGSETMHCGLSTQEMG